LEAGDADKERRFLCLCGFQVVISASLQPGFT
jgi:hypothetical protein